MFDSSSEVNSVTFGYLISHLQLETSALLHAATTRIKATMPSSKYGYAPWHVTHSIAPASAFITAILYGLYILSYPPRSSLTRKLHILLLALPLGYAFINSDDISSSYTAVDTFSRTCIIWFVHMSYEVCVLEFSPVVADKARDIEGGGKMGRWEEMRERLRQGYKVLFDRNHTQILEAQSHHHIASTSISTSLPEYTYLPTNKKTDESLHPGNEVYPAPLSKGQAHGYTRSQFLCYHIVIATSYYLLRKTYEFYEEHYSPATFNTTNDYAIIAGSFFRRIPASLAPTELYYRFEIAFDWNIVSIWLYESFHSIVALLWVGSFIDAPSEWSISLFGPIGEAWNVRRYWGKHWHNYVYHSFSGHVKCVTRGWLGIRRGRLVTRLLENTAVFVLSGLMHTLVRWQQSPRSDIWAISLWYVGQMLPIVAESVVSLYWRKVRKSWGIRDDAKWVNRAEYAVGYCWVTGWFMWSVPKYLTTRMQWTDEKVKRKWREDFSMHDVPPENETSKKEWEELM
jgi:hypothetical protein